MKRGKKYYTRAFCKYCGKSFVVPYGIRNPKFCSTVCKTQASKKVAQGEEI